MTKFACSCLESTGSGAPLIEEEQEIINKEEIKISKDARNRTPNRSTIPSCYRLCNNPLQEVNHEFYKTQTKKPPSVVNEAKIN
ncbi:hypothetical protein [Agrobacterium radiobacter]|uniref:hypothetical protein n=1 Tax=Agrobacterium radiobacter TaxID=362 RepID=UPI003F878956